MNTLTADYYWVSSPSPSQSFSLHDHGDDDEKGGGERTGLLGGKKQLGCQLGGGRIHEVK